MSPLWEETARDHVRVLTVMYPALSRRVPVRENSKKKLIQKKNPEVQELLLQLLGFFTGPRSTTFSNCGTTLQFLAVS